MLSTVPFKQIENIDHFTKTRIEELEKRTNTNLSELKAIILGQLKITLKENIDLVKHEQEQKFLESD